MKEPQSKIKNLLSFNIETVLAFSVSIFLFPIYSHYISLDQFGMRAIVLMSYVIFESLSGLGLNWLIRRRAKSEQKLKNLAYFFNVLIIYLIIRISFAVIILGSEQLMGSFFTSWDESYTELFYLYLPVYVMSSSVTGLTELFVINQQAKRFSLIFSISLLISTGTTVYLVVAKGLGVVALFYGDILKSLCFIILASVVGKKFMGFGNQFLLVLTDIKKIGLAAVPKNIVSQLQANADRYVIQIFLPVSDLGAYTRSQIFLNAYGSLSIAFSRAYSPAYIGSYDIPGKRLKFCGILKNWFLFIVILYSLSTVVISDIFDLFNVHESFHIVAVLGPVLALRSTILVYDVWHSNNIVHSGETKYFFYRSLVSFPIALCMLIVLTYRYGIDGAAISALAYPIISMGASIIITRKYLLYQDLCEYGTYLAGITVMVLVCYANYMGIFNEASMQIVAIAGLMIAGIFYFWSQRRSNGR